jgi:hypothetical protein
MYRLALCLLFIGLPTYWRTGAKTLCVYPQDTLAHVRFQDLRELCSTFLSHNAVHKGGIPEGAGGGVGVLSPVHRDCAWFTQGHVVAARRFAAISKGYFFNWLWDDDAGSFVHGEDAFGCRCRLYMLHWEHTSQSPTSSRPLGWSSNAPLSWKPIRTWTFAPPWPSKGSHYHTRLDLILIDSSHPGPAEIVPCVWL